MPLEKTVKKVGVRDGSKYQQIKKWKAIFLQRLKKYNPHDQRRCNVCGKRKFLKMFYSHIQKTKSGHETIRTGKSCKECYKNKLRKIRNLIMKDKHIKRRSHYKKRWRYSCMKSYYGINEEQYKSMLKKQNNKCAIC